MSRPKKMLPVVGQAPVAPPDSQETASSERAERTVLRVEGMDCASCAATVERCVARVPGVRRAVVNFAAGRLDTEHDPGLAVEEIEDAVRDAGYGVERTEETERVPFWRTPRALLVLASALLFALGLALSLVGAPEVLRVGAYAAAVVVGGFKIFRAALAGLRAWRLDMNVLMSAAVIGGMAIGEWAEAASVVVLFAAGNALQVYAIDRTRGAVRALARLAPDEVLVRRGGSEVIVLAEEVGVGALVVVRPGERLAVDGEVVEGASAVDESPVTGESVPVEKGPGDKVFSGSLNGSGGLLVRATKRAADSTLRKIARLVEEAQARKAPTEQFVDRFSRVYTPLVVAVAVVLAIVPPLLGASFGEWFYRGLALLIIACPCALVISTPVTVVSGIGAASRRGILIKGGAALEAAGKLKALAFDKTGTLTEGRPTVASVEEAGETPVVLGGEGGALAVFGLADTLRPDARATLEALRDAGVEKLVMLTGDAEAPARRTADALSVDYRAQLLPEQKVEAVRDLVSKNGTVGMVGDGVNDAPALAAASVGFAMGAAGTDVALNTADVALMQDDLPKLAEAVRLSRGAEQIIHQNVLASVLIKGIFVLLAPFGLVALWLAVLADMGTSIAVILNGLRLFRQGRA